MIGEESSDGEIFTLPDILDAASALTMKRSNKIAATLLVLTEGAIMGLLAVFGKYEHTWATADKTYVALGANSLRYEYMLQVMVMLMVGMGYYASYMSKYAFSSLGFSLLFMAVAAQLSIIYEIIISNPDSIRLIDICNGAAMTLSLLLAMGGTMGRLTYLQMVVHLYLELGGAALNRFLLRKVLYAVDLGGALSVYAFGSLFGVVVSYFLGDNVNLSQLKEGGHVPQTTDERSYHSDTHSLMGALFTWVFFPAFHAAQCYSPLMQYHAIVNTVFATAGACVGGTTAFGLMYLYTRPIAHGAQGAFVSGAVVVSALAPLDIHPAMSIIYGTAASALVAFLHKLLLERLWKYDSMRYSLAFLVPGLISSILACFYISVHETNAYKEDTKYVFPGEDAGMSNLVQVSFQVASIVCTVALAVIGGAITGILLRTKMFKKWPDPTEMYRDHYNFVLPRTID